MTQRINKALAEVSGLLRGPQRFFSLIQKIASDKVRITSEYRHLYSYSTSRVPSGDALTAVIRWILAAQRSDGGIAAYYSLLSGYSESYPEVSGYIVPTLYDFELLTGDEDVRRAASRAVEWLLSLQMPSGAFPAGLHRNRAEASVFNTGQILQGLVRAWSETSRGEVGDAAIAAGNWLVNMQQPDGSWSGPGAYQGVAHTYYSMVSWALAQLSERIGNERFGLAAERNLEWVLSHIKTDGSIYGIQLHGHPHYLHFIGYVLQGVLECAILRRRNDALQAIEKPAWVLLRKFETNKHLPGAFDDDFKSSHRFTCLTGNAQMSCVWLRLFEVTRDARYLNAVLKMNEMLKLLLPTRGHRGVRGGVSGSYPVWGAYQPMRYISWGCKFLADALMLEQHMMQSMEATLCAS
jgi:prenyltransferase/squalene oxidase-like repeat protein